MGKKITEMRSPEWVKMHKRWRKYRLAYEGGEEFVHEYLTRYSKRENKREYEERKDLAYNPAHLTKCLNRYRNAIIARLHEIKRTGDAVYLKACEKDIDLQGNSMTAFMGLKYLTLLMAQGKRGICLDAPAILGAGTRDEDTGLPYIWEVEPENFLAWGMDGDGRLSATLMEEAVSDVPDADSGLQIAAVTQYRYMRLLAKGESVLNFDKPGVVIRQLDCDDKDVKEPVFLEGAEMIPFAETRLVDSFAKDTSDIQRGLLNLNSTDMCFLFRGNFPIFVKQTDPSKTGIKPIDKHRAVQPGQETEVMDRTTDDGENRSMFEVGNNRGIQIPKEVLFPQFIAPPTENLVASMDKQKDMKEEINILLDLSLASMAVKAMEQSGKKAQIDAVGLDVGLAYLGNVLEQTENNVADRYHMLLGSKAAHSVTYPVSYSMENEQDRLTRVTSYNGIKNASRSPKYQREVEKIIATTTLTASLENDDLKEVTDEIDSMEWFDADVDRSGVVQKDIVAGLVDAETGTEVRGYPEGTAGKIKDAAQAASDALSGGPVIPPSNNPGQPNPAQNPADAGRTGQFGRTEQPGTPTQPGANPPVVND